MVTRGVATIGRKPESDGPEFRPKASWFWNSTRSLSLLDVSPLDDAEATKTLLSSCFEVASGLARFGRMFVGWKLAALVGLELGCQLESTGVWLLTALENPGLVSGERANCCCGPTIGIVGARLLA